MAHHPDIAKFLKSAAEYLDLEDPTNANREQARRMLRDEFIDALADGPLSPVSMPPMNGVEEVPVYQVVRSMFYAAPHGAYDLCTELASEMPDVPLLLANKFADLWLEYLDAAEALTRNSEPTLP